MEMDRNIEDYLREGEVILWKSIKIINLLKRLIIGCVFFLILLAFMCLLLNEYFLRSMLFFKFLIVGILGFSILIVMGVGVIEPILLTWNAKKIGYNINDLKKYTASCVLTNMRLIHKTTNYMTLFGLPKQISWYLYRQDDLMFMVLSEIHEIFISHSKKSVRIQFRFQNTSDNDIAIFFDLNLGKEDFEAFWSTFNMLKKIEKKRIEEHGQIFTIQHLSKF